MQYVGSIKVIPELPSEIKRLEELAHNFYFAWSPEARQTFRLINPELWTKINHNPVKFLREVQQRDLDRCANDPEYLSLYKRVMREFDEYMNSDQTWYRVNFPKDKNKTIAYFSAEFGFHESLPIYSGGLGVLAGDHLKSASDLGLPLVGVSLFYHQTYFTQQIDAHGNQIALYIPQNGYDLPLTKVTQKDGSDLVVSVPVGNRDVKFIVWRAQIGRIPAFLLDANIAENPPEDRMITARLYGGDEEMRISQEILLGMGGVRALRAMGIDAQAWHMNEGHSVFLALERIRQLVQERKLSFYEALEAVAANTIFTTHTPVPAGNDAFPLHFVEKFFQRYWESVGIRRYQFMELGSQVQPEGYEIFNLTILSLKLSKFRNGVSKLHGEVSRNLWKDAWPGIPVNEIPIGHVTNGVHASTWVVYALRKLYEKHLSHDWMEHVDEPAYWRGVFGIPDKELWDAKNEVKRKMLNHMRERIRAQIVRNKVGTLQLHRLEEMLNPNILTIGFARRFATYKRAMLIFRNKERLKRILNNPERPVQLLFSGKAHPKDLGGQELIRQLNVLANEDGFRGRIFFIENYDMSVARDLISGVDVWLNNPRRPQEASGTSGQKVGLNGGINFSVLDGWWVEGYNGENGFAFGDREDYRSLEELDNWDSEAIYDILENDLVPMYYNRGADGLPHDWIKMMKHSIASVMPQFNTHRMVKDYVQQLYIPAIKNGERFAQDDYLLAKEYTAWCEHIQKNWKNVRVELMDLDLSEEIVLHYNEPVKVKAKLFLGDIDPADVKVQVYLYKERPDTVQIEEYEIVEMTRKKKLDEGVFAYEAAIIPSNSGNYRFTIRVLPYHKSMSNPVELGLIKWLEQPQYHG
jgi:starch phosphorylase